jgi:hypothetical protein
MDENEGFFVNTPPADAEVPRQSSPNLEIGYRIRQAQRAGFGDKEIISELAKELPNVNQALKAGFKPTDIVNEYLSSSMGVGEVASRAISNIPSSFGSMVGNIVEAVTSPVQTAKSVLDLGAGILQNVLPESLVQAVGEDKASREVASKVGQFYADRYGSVEGAKRAIAEDPVGVLADVSTILTGGALATPRAVSQPLARAASAIDPLAIAGRGALRATELGGRGVANVLGLTTGAGKESIAKAFEAGQRGGEAAEQFRANISGRADPTEVLSLAKANLDEMNRLKQTEYRSGMVNIKKDKTVLDFADIDKALENAFNRVTYKGQVKNAKAAERITEVQQDVAQWKALDPNEFHTPEGLDALKQKIGDTLESVPFEQKTARASIGEIYNSVKSSIQKQAPTYANTMREYSVASEQIREIERALSLGKGASVDTAMRKLQSLMRNNVQTNYGSRTKLAQQLEKVGGQEFMPGLAGQALSSVTPRGLQTATAIPTGALAYGIGGLPSAGLSLLAASPRAVGEAAYGVGALGRGIGGVTRRAPFIIDPRTFNALFQAGQIQGQTE